MKDDAPVGYRTGYFATITATHTATSQPYSEIVRVIFSSTQEGERYLKERYIPRLLEVKGDIRKNIFAINGETIKYTFTDVWVSESIFQDSAPVA